MTNTDLMADVFLPEPRATDDSEWGIVRAVNDDGSYMVQLRGSSALTRCGNYCTAVVGDRVHVVIKKNGLCEVIGRRGGTIGGGGEVVTTVNDASNYVAGKVFAHAGTNDPVGALLCDGRAVSRTTYWELFDAIGTTYGAGDGSSTFNLPNIESRTIIGESDGYALGSTGGEEKHKLTVDEMPSHKHGAMSGSSTASTGVYAFRDHIVSSSDVAASYRYLNAMNNEGGDQPHNIMQPYIVMRYFITTGKGDPVSGINPADYVVEWGTTGIWRWEKWASGKAECWGFKWIGPIDITQTWGGWYFHTAQAIDSYPFEFTELPKVVAFKENGAEGALVAAGVGSTTAPAKMYLVRPNSYTDGEYRIHIHAKGFWKDSPASGGTETIAPTIAEKFEKVEKAKTWVFGLRDRCNQETQTGTVATGWQGTTVGSVLLAGSDDWSDYLTINSLSYTLKKPGLYRCLFRIHAGFSGAAHLGAGWFNGSSEVASDWVYTGSNSACTAITELIVNVESDYVITPKVYAGNATCTKYMGGHLTNFTIEYLGAL